MIRKILTAATLLVMLTATGVSAGAKPNSESGGDRERHRGHGAMRPDFSDDPVHMVKMMSRHLDLDETQLQTISKLLQAIKPATDSLRERSRTNREALRALDLNDANYPSSLQALAVESGQLAAERTLLHGRVRGEIHAVLTAEQQQKVASHVGKTESHWQHPANDE